MESRAANHLKRLAKDDKTSLSDFVNTTKSLNVMFKMAKLSAKISEEMKKIVKEIKFW